MAESSFGQKPLTRKISFLEGLPSDVVYDLFVDHQGLLYLGTNKGLVTYNGVHFDQLNNPESLGNSISSLQQDHLGKIWCKNFSNQLFFVQNNKLIEDAVVKKLLAETDSNLVDFCVGTNSLYILTQKKVYFYASGRIKSIFKMESEDIEGFNSLIFDKKKRILYVSSPNFIYTFKNNRLIKKTPTIAGQKALAIFKGKLSYNFKSLLANCMVDEDTITLNNPDLTKTFFNKLSNINQDLWLCTNNGIYEFDADKKEFKNGFLNGIRISDIVVDLEGNHWISSLDEGLFLLPNKKIYELEMPFSYEKEKISYTRIAKGPNENYFIGTNDGRILETSKHRKNIRIYNTNYDNNIEFINFDGDTILTNYGFFKIGNPQMISEINYFGKDLQTDKKGNFLVASPSFGGLLSKDLKSIPNFENSNKKFQFINYTSEKCKALVFRDKRAKSVLYHSIDKKYYLGFIDGLFVYDEKGNEQEIRTNKNEPIIVVSMIENADGSLWVASSQKGLFLIKNQKIVTHISQDNGLSDNHCKRIAKDKYGIWIVTDKGFDYYNQHTKRVKNAEINICIKGITINDIGIYKNIIVLATSQGIYYFNKNVVNQESLPRFNFTDFLVNNKKIALTKELTLKYNQNNINIKFNTIHYRSLGDYTYRYRLMGLDDKWYAQSSNAKNINFLALTPGKYKFQINIKIGERYTPIQEINFEINKPFWLQFWFLSISILALIALLYLVYRWAEIKTKKSEKLKEQLALSQLTALRSQMNPHFIFNILNAVQGLIYSNQKSKASDYLGKFSDLMRRILDTSDKNEVTLEKEFETIDLYVSLEKARFENDFEYIITFPEEVDLSQYTIPSMIIQPFVENAIKHGLMHKSGFKQLKIKVELLEDVWCFTIDDNGIGRKASEMINQKIKKHISFATKAIDNRVKLISKTTNMTIDIEVIDKKSRQGEALGTRIKIYIPISKG